jgi:hypothetical protein
MLIKAMLIDANAKNNSSKAKKILACFTGFFINNKTQNTMACTPKIRIMVKAIGFEEVIV